MPIQSPMPCAATKMVRAIQASDPKANAIAAISSARWPRPIRRVW
jgi:hypothetical protein